MLSGSDGVCNMDFGLLWAEKRSCELVSKKLTKANQHKSLGTVFVTLFDISIEFSLFPLTL